MTNVNEFLREKLQNFKKFVLENLPAQLSKFKELIDGLTVDALIIMTVKELKPNKDHLDELIDAKFNEVDLTEPIDPAHRAKLKRYLEMFIDIVN